MVDVLVIFGPNLNMLGTREPEIYGVDSLADIMGFLSDQAADLGLSIEMMQSNDEGVLVTAIQKARVDTLRWRCAMPWRCLTAPRLKCICPTMTGVRRFAR